ncbi:DUF4411 family protein [Candidatus Aerophobetes bacterium]|nr:DUF4411 family protein [Candidatus Aerophobetes bacterium]
MESIKIYCIDTSALIDMKILYPQDIFSSLWKNMEKLIKQRRLISPYEVLEELRKKDDELLKWAEIHKSMFKNLDANQLEKVRDILRLFPNLVDFQKTTPDADPFVIALAMCEEQQRTLWEEQRIVVSEEKPAHPGARPKIPDVCKSYGVECISLMEFFRKENWQF